jgi:hypothetical protein
MDTAVVNATADGQAGDAEKCATVDIPHANSVDHAFEGYLSGAKVSLGKKQFWIVFLG